MKYLQTLDRLSFAKVISIAILIAILFALPVAYYLIQHQTRINTRAAYLKPRLVTQRLNANGPVPAQPPKIGRAYPWVGKVGDIVWLQGKNFGQNPKDKQLTIGGVMLKDSDITAWEDELIQAVIPEGAKQGGVVEVRLGSHPVARSLPYVLYNQKTLIKLHKRNNVITADNAVAVDRALVWTGDDETLTQQFTFDIIPEQGETTIVDLKGLPLLTILLLDEKGQVLPYYVDPVEWGF